MASGRPACCLAFSRWRRLFQSGDQRRPAGGNLIILLDSGELELITATPKGFQAKSRVQVVGRPTRSYPAIVDGYAFIKGPKELVCLDLRARK